MAGETFLKNNYDMEMSSSVVSETGSSIEDKVSGVLMANGINPVTDGDNSWVDSLLYEYDSIENINKLIIFSRLVRIKLDDISDFFMIKKNLKDLKWASSPDFDPYIDPDSIIAAVISMDKKFLEQLRKLLGHMTLFEFSLFTVIKNGALSDGLFDNIYFIIKGKEVTKGQKGVQNGNDLSNKTGESSDWHENKKKIGDVLMNYYLNKMSISKCLDEGDIKDKIVWLKKIIEENGKFTDDVLEEENFKDFMQWYRNRKIVTLLCNMCGREGSILLENDKEKLCINFDEYF